jgi:NTE family protein
VAVILGPGGAKALAHVGVLKAFEQQRLPIQKIIGLEWGALVAGLYSVKGQINDVEWKLYKMEQRGLPVPKGFFAKNLGENPIKIMDDYFADAFQRQEVSAAHLAFECPSRSLWTGVVVWQNRGLYKDVMKRCLPYPPLFRTQGTFLAGPSQVQEAIERLRGEGFNVIILVNVLGSALPVAQDVAMDNLDYVLLWQEVKHAMLEAEKLGVEVVNVDTSPYPMVQFEAKKDLLTLGESAGQKAAAALISKYGF